MVLPAYKSTCITQNTVEGIGGPWSPLLPSYGRLLIILFHKTCPDLYQGHWILYIWLYSSYCFTITPWLTGETSLFWASRPGTLRAIFLERTCGLNNFQESENPSSNWSTLPLYKLYTNHTHLRYFGNRRSWLWLYSASSPFGSGVVSTISLSPLGSSIPNLTVIF